MTSQPLTNKSALITGAAKRIGCEIALTLARAGADITITYNTSATQAAETVREIESLGRRAQAVACDVRSEASVHAAVQSAAAFHGHLHILINNAAIFESAPLDRLTVAQWDAIFETNTRGPFLLSREALPHLRVAAGKIVNIGSLGGLEPWATHAHYCSSKAALHMLTQCMAKAFAPEVSVNAVAPGRIEMDDHTAQEALHFAAITPLRRNGTPDDVAQAVLFLVAQSTFITGQILTVDGGLGL
jgi:3-oxoacyl-[acyl-carrier protein] reductase/pteridine reductase